VHSLATAREAALPVRLGPKAVLVKGGHLPGEDVVDLLYDGHHLHELRARASPAPTARHRLHAGLGDRAAGPAWAPGSKPR
jgi:hydroxymethylpyrimidine/phosphomethylpyrimidine kinase